MSKWLCLVSILLSCTACDFITTEDEEPERQPTQAQPDEQDTDCVKEMQEDPLNGPSSGSFGPVEIVGGVCDGRDEFSVNVSSMCTLKTQLTFDRNLDEDGNLIADGDLEVLYYGSFSAIGSPERINDTSKVTITNNPTDDSFGAVRIRVKHTAGTQLNYKLNIETVCP